MEARLSLEAATFFGAPLRFSLGSSEPNCRARRPKGAAVVTRRLSSRGPGLLQRLLLPAARCLASSTVPALPSGAPEQSRHGHVGAATAATRALGGGAVPAGPSAGIKAHGLRKLKGPRSPPMVPQGSSDLRPSESPCLSMALPAGHVAVPLEESPRARGRVPLGPEAGSPLSLASRGDTLRRRRQRAAVLSAAVLAPEAELVRVDKREPPNNSTQCEGAACTEADALYASRAGDDAMAVDLAAEFEQMAMDTDVLEDDDLKGAHELLEHSWQLPAWPLGRDVSTTPDVESFVSRLLKKRRSGRGERSAAPDPAPGPLSASPCRGLGGQRRLERVQQVIGAVAGSCDVAEARTVEEGGRVQRETARRERVRQVLLAQGAVAEPEGAEIGINVDTVPGEEQVVVEESFTAKDEQLQAKLAGAISAAVAGQFDLNKSEDSVPDEEAQGGEEWGLSQEEEMLSTGDLPQEQEVLVKFAEDTDVGSAGGPHGSVSPLSPSSIRVRRRSLDLLRKRRSVELGQRERILVRSMRKRRLSLGSRVGVKGQGAGLDSREVAGSTVGEEDEMDNAELEALLEGYGWRGDSKLEWDPTRRLLYPDEEKKIIRVLEKGQKMKEIQALLQGTLGREPTLAECATEAKTTTLAVQRTLELFNAARNKLVMHNLGLVVSIARLYRSMGYGVDFDSLCQRGVKGLYAAADRFNSKRNCRFSTLASVCVRTVVTREIAASMHVRAPTYCSYKFMLMQRVSRELESKLRRRPTDEEVALVCKIGVPQLRLIRKLFLEYPLLLHQEATGTGLQMVEIVTGNGKEDDSEEVAGTAEPESVRYALDDVIDSLKPKEAVVIRQRFGLDGYGERSMAEVGRNLSISREMVRKYEARALAKLQLQERADLFHSRLSVYS